MLKFKAMEYAHTRPITPSQGIVAITNRASRLMASKLNNTYKGTCCDHHPDVQSVIICDMKQKSQEWFSVESYCCEEFKEYMEHIISASPEPEAAK